MGGCQMEKEYYLGLDIGTNSVGYAVADSEYKILKYKGEPMWGSHVFEEGSQCAERRGFRTARRRLDRRQQRVRLVQEIFANEISLVDDKFYIRLKESALYQEDKSGNNPYSVFADDNYTDKEYYEKYPTIHHLIMDLIEDEQPHDVRLVYMAAAWLVAHRGHFLSDVEKTHVEKVLDFDGVYRELQEYYNDNGYTIPWKDDEECFKDILLQNCGVRDKENLFKNKLFEGTSYKSKEDDSIGNEAVITLLAGGTVDARKLFLNAEFEEKISICFRKSEEEFESVLIELDDYADFLIRLRAVYDWSLLYEASGGQSYISKAKIAAYDQHKKDLNYLKYFIKKYCPEKYESVFRKPIEGNYVMYSYNFSSIKENEKRPNRKTSQEDFCAYIKKIIKDVDCDIEDQTAYEDMMMRLDLCTFMPKQVNNDNRVIPYQLYYYELSKILDTVSKYLPFIDEVDSDGYSNRQKLLSIMEFRVPYYVGPLHREHEKSSFAWVQRKANGRIYPWNYKEKVDLDASEQAFINKMTNQCSYLPGEDVLPKYSLKYCAFEVLNEINNIKINGIDIPVECKQGIYRLFEKKRKVTRKDILDYLKSNNYMTDHDEMTGIDVNVKSSLKSYHDFRKLLESEMLNNKEVEEIITYLTYTEDKARIRKFLNEKYANLLEEDRKYISKLKYKDFGRLSEKFLVGVKAAIVDTGECVNLMHALWETNDNLMQIIFSDKYTFKEQIESEKQQYYENNPKSLEQLLDDMYVSNAVKRPIYRTLDVVNDVRKACGRPPKKIFVEMARGGGEKGKRSVSRREQIKELYKSVDKQEVREISKLLDSKTDNELQSEVLFLYFMQLGKCMYSGETIDIERIKSDTYVNVDHIYPQAYVKDDSLNNKVLVKSELNGLKSDKYPINSEIRKKMFPIWKSYRERGLISEEKFYRLTRQNGFSQEEKQGFINRQLVETRQSTKAITEVLKSKFPDTEIVYVKAGLAADFKHEYGIVKSRSINDLHHAKDAYLNIVCGNVYHTKFTKKFFMNHDEYSIKTSTVYKKPIVVDGECIWNGEESIAFVKKVLSKNNIHYTRYAFCRNGGLFDQMPVSKKEGLIPRKIELDTTKYGGYNKSTASFFIFAKYTEKAKKEKTDIMLVPIDLMVANKVLSDETFAIEYICGEIAEISNKKKEEIINISFPYGLRPIKINTRFSFDGFEACVTGKSSGGKQLMFSSLMALKLNYKQEKYIKKLERFNEKKKINSKIIFDEKYDGINAEENMILYDILFDKLKNSNYKIVFGVMYDLLLNNKDNFNRLDLAEQSIVLLNMISIFKTGRSGGCDLSLLKIKAKAFFINSSKISNWKNNYTCVRIINESPSGIFRTESDNILEWL